MDRRCVGATRWPRRERWNSFVVLSRSGGIQLEQIAVSDRGRLEGLTQFRFSLPHGRRQKIGTTGHIESDMREGGFCATLFRTARKSLILNGEMLERSIRHAWKLTPLARADAHQITPTRLRS